MKSKIISILFALVLVLSLSLVMAVPAAAQDPAVFGSGGDRLVAQQNGDGGWGWPLTGDSATNTIGPIGIGLAETYRQTDDANHLVALGWVGTFLLTKTNNFTCWDGYLAVQLDNIFGGTTYTDFVKANFYDLLEAGTYVGKSGTYGTQSYIVHINYAWDLGIGLISAVSVGIDQAEVNKWIDGVKTAIDGLVDPTDDYYASDLAGGLYGLAYAGETGLDGLAVELASLQETSGVFDSGHTMDTQNTAYALLALSEFDRSGYRDNITRAGAYLENAQLVTGGWQEFPDDPEGENNEFTAEALWALSAVGSGSVSMSASYIPPVIGVSVEPTSVDFGSVVPGVASATKTVKVTNIGNVAEDFSADLANESPAGVYTDGLAIDASLVGSWGATDVAFDDYVEPKLILTVPTETAPGIYTATLIFWAEEATP